MVRCLPLFAPVWVSSTVGAPLGILSSPRLARIRYGSTLLATFRAIQLPNLLFATQRRPRWIGFRGFAGSNSGTRPTGAA